MQFQEFQHRSSRDILEALSHTDTLHGQSQLLGILYFREGPQFWTENGKFIYTVWSIFLFCGSFFMLKKMPFFLKRSLISFIVLFTFI